MSDPPSRRFRLPLLGPVLGLIAGFLAGRQTLTPSTEPALHAPGPPDDLPPRARPVPSAAGVMRQLRRGAPGAGGLYAAWSAESADGKLARHIEYQYAGMAHQAAASLSGMWLFLATELIFFGALFMLYMVYRAFHPAGFAAASQHAELWIGTLNTILLLTTSAVFTWGVGAAKRGANRAVFWAAIVTFALGAAFLALKGYEWKLDFDNNLFPGPGFAITGPDAGGAQLFWSFYFVATGLHGIHMIIGLVLVAWIAWTARRVRFSPGYYGPVEAVGLYWSFVDMVWLCLYPMIYLVHGGGR